MVLVVLRSAQAALFTFADGPSKVSKYLDLGVGGQLSPLPLAGLP